MLQVSIYECFKAEPEVWKEQTLTGEREFSKLAKKSSL